MEEVRRVVEEALRDNFPGAEIRWEDDSEHSRAGGTLLWEGFQGVPQLERQRRVGAVLRQRLGERKQDVGVIFTLTPSELEVVCG